MVASGEEVCEPGDGGECGGGVGGGGGEREVGVGPGECMFGGSLTGGVGGGARGGAPRLVL